MPVQNNFGSPNGLVTRTLNTVTKRVIAESDLGSLTEVVLGQEVYSIASGKMYKYISTDPTAASDMSNWREFMIVGAGTGSGGEADSANTVKIISLAEVQNLSAGDVAFTLDGQSVVMNYIDNDGKILQLTLGNLTDSGLTVS